MKQDVANAESGVLIASDETTIVYLQHENRRRVEKHKFIIKEIDKSHIFVKTSSMDLIRQLLDDRVKYTCYDAQAAALEGEE